MPRTEKHHPAAKAAAATKYLPLLADPLYPLAEAVGHAVVHEITVYKQQAAKSVARGSATAPAIRDLRTALEVSAQLYDDLKALVSKVLEESLSAPTVEGKALRMALIGKLASQEMGGQVPTLAAVPAKAEATDGLLTTAEAAARLEASRPYVSMLCDAGKLGKVIMTEGGHRRIRTSAVEAHLTARAKAHDRALSPRQAGLQAGLYEHDDSHYVNAARNSAAPVARSVKAPMAKATPKSRS